MVFVALFSTHDGRLHNIASIVDSLSPPSFRLAADDSPPNRFRGRITSLYHVGEAVSLQPLLVEAEFVPQALAETQRLAASLAQGVRNARSRAGGVDALMLEFSLDSREGVALMCLAEALLRIPDAATRDRLIRDKIGGGDWRAHVGRSPSLFVNAAAWAQRFSARGCAHFALAQGWRAADPQGRRPGDAAARQAVRHRTLHRRGHCQRPRARGSRLSVFV